MSVNINKWDCLVVNKNWMVLGLTTIKKSLISIHSSNDGSDMAARPFNINYKYLGDDKYDFGQVELISPVSLEEWLELPIRPYDNIIHSAHKTIRIPTVIQAQNCDKTHLRDIKLTTKAILERDNFTCQYSGKQLPRNKLNIDHIISRDEWKKRNLPGTPDNWKNMVACDKNINSIKSNKSLKDTDLKLIKEPREPLPIPASALIREIRYKDWEFFIAK